MDGEHQDAQGDRARTRRAGGMAPLGETLKGVSARVSERRQSARSTSERQSSSSSSSPAGEDQGGQRPRQASPLQAAAEQIRIGRTPLARLLPARCRALCEGCFGTGLAGGEAEIAGCAGCAVVGQDDTSAGLGAEVSVCYEPCELHVCRVCLGKGVVCPDCRGARFQREPAAWGNRAVRCASCTEGNNVSAVREMAAIQRELARLQGMARQGMARHGMATRGQ